MAAKSDVKCGKARLGAEIAIWRSGFELAVGTDEAGRGPLAGPVCAGAVAIVDPAAADERFRFLLAEVNDSKLLVPPVRGEIYKIITAHPAIVWGFAAVSPGIIDKINILQASRLAMKRAISSMMRHFAIAAPPEKIFCLVDGNSEIDVEFAQQTVIGGDRKIFSISAASIIAKVGRDRLMAGFDKKYPAYGFEKHKGYGTRRHLEALARLGPCPIHRRSFSPVREPEKKFSTGGHYDLSRGRPRDKPLETNG